VGRATAWVTVAALAALGAVPAQAQDRVATTNLFSRAADGGTPNGPSTNPWISGDSRYAQIVAFESEASDLVSGDTNGVKDVFAVRRAGSFGDDGSEWQPGKTQLVSRTSKGKPANGPSYDATTDGNMKSRARCVAFLSDASNLVRGDTNKKTDAFLAKAPDFLPKRVSLPYNRQSSANTTHVAVSGDCSEVAFVAGGKLFIRKGSATRRISTKSNPADPAYDSGDTNSLVYGASGGAYLLADGSSRPTRVAKGASNPAYINRRRLGKPERWVTYEIEKGGFTQIAYRRIGGGERIATTWAGQLGNGDSRDPAVFNSGFNMSFTTTASNLSIKSSGQIGDRNGARDAYFFTRTDKFDPPVTILESVGNNTRPMSTGAQNVTTSYYRNYALFDSSGDDPTAPPQVYLRYLGGI
jgi:hypothetical protein